MKVIDKNYLNSLLPNWNLIRSIGSSPIMRATILIPFLGYMVLLNEQLVQYLRLAESLIGLEAGERAEGSNILEENRLKLIYIGLVILGLASSLYALFCPGMIQKFGSDAEYLEAELKSMSPDKMRYLRLQVSKHDNISSKWYGSWFLRLEERYKNYHDAKNLFYLWRMDRKK